MLTTIGHAARRVVASGSVPDKERSGSGIRHTYTAAASCEITDTSATQEVRTEDAAGERTITYEVTFTNGVETGKRRVTSEATQEPVDQVVVVGTKQPEPEPAPEPDPEEESGCHQSYTVCAYRSAWRKSTAPAAAQRPAYVRDPVFVVGDDEYRLDRDGDGVACE